MQTINGKSLLLKESIQNVPIYGNAADISQ